VENLEGPESLGREGSLERVENLESLEREAENLESLERGEEREAENLESPERREERVVKKEERVERVERGARRAERKAEKEERAVKRAEKVERKAEKEEKAEEREERAERKAEKEERAERARREERAERKEEKERRARTTRMPPRAETILETILTRMIPKIPKTILTRMTLTRMTLERMIQSTVVTRQIKMVRTPKRLHHPLNNRCRCNNNSNCNNRRCLHSRSLPNSKPCKSNRNSSCSNRQRLPTPRNSRNHPISQPGNLQWPMRCRQKNKPHSFADEAMLSWICFVASVSLLLCAESGRELAMSREDRNRGLERPLRDGTGGGRPAATPDAGARAASSRAGQSDAPRTSAESGN